MSKFLRICSLVILAGLLSMAGACGGKPAAEAQAPPMEEKVEVNSEAPPAEPVMQAEPVEETVADVQAEEPATPPSEESEAQPSALMPGEPPESIRTLEDSDSSLRASEHRVLSGDNILNNLYERPFTAVDMVYQPDLDIYTVDISFTDDFFYFTITLNAMDLESTTLYGIEFDRSKTGRGDLLVLAQNPGDDWSMDNMIVLSDKDGDVGGVRPVVAEEGFSGTGYDQQVDLGEDRVAYSRIAPDEPTAIQIAVSLPLLENPEEFLWGAWVDNGLQDFGKFDYNDAIGPSEAGSPFKDSVDYPIDALYSLDNTCRLPFGFEQETSTVPGTCVNVAPAISSASGGCIPYCVRRCTTHAGCCEWGCR